MTTYLGKSYSFGLPRVPFVDCRQFMYLVISLLVLRAGCGIWLYQFLIIAYLFTLPEHWSMSALLPVFRTLMLSYQGVGEMWTLIQVDNFPRHIHWQVRWSWVRVSCSGVDLVLAGSREIVLGVWGPYNTSSKVILLFRFYDIGVSGATKEGEGN